MDGGGNMAPRELLRLIKPVAILLYSPSLHNVSPGKPGEYVLCPCAVALMSAAGPAH